MLAKVLATITTLLAVLALLVAEAGEARTHPGAKHHTPLRHAPKSVYVGVYAGEVGLASWYGWNEHGKPMSDGHPFHALGVNAAHRSLPLGSFVRVTNLANRRTAIVVIRDRGPYVRGRIIDVSLGTARQLGMEHAGTARVRLEVVR